MANPNYRLVKLHRTYTVDEAARRLSVHRNTVRHWIKDGLPTVDSHRPTLILGSVLQEFLRARRTRNRRTCGPGEIYCVRCRLPVKPALDMVDYRPSTATLGSLVGMCPNCEALIYRRVNVTQLDQIRGNLEVSKSQAPPRIGESVSPFVNSDFTPEPRNHDNAQPK